MIALDNELLDGFYLNDLLVEPLTGQVSLADRSAHLPSKAAEVLLFLAKHPRRLVTREEIIDKVWGTGHGSNETLSHAVSEIRHALDDDSSNPVYIQTVPTRGYRLLVEPRVAGSDERPREIASATEPDLVVGFWGALIRHGVVQAGAAYLVAGWLLIQIADATFDNIGMPDWAEPLVNFTVIGGFPIVILLSWFFEFAEGRLSKDRGRQSAGLLQGLERNYIAIFIAFGISAVGAGVYQASVGFPEPPGPVDPLKDPRVVPVLDNAVAVLELATFDEDATASLFAKGLSEDLIDALAGLPGLLVSARGDAWSLPVNSPSDLVRERLRVAKYVEGSVRIVGNQLRVVIQLIDSSTGFHIVSRDFEHEMQDFANLQREVTDLVVANLRPALDDDPAGQPLLAHEPTDTDAYVLYRRGIEYLYKPGTPELIGEAKNYFLRALEIDPDYPAAHAGLCSANTSLFEMTRNPDDIAAAERSCGEAIAAAPRLPQVLNAVGRLYVSTGKLIAAESTYRQALQINDQDATAMRGLATVAQRAQRLDEAEQLLNRAVELQPGNWRAISSLGDFYFGIGRYADAASQYQKAMYLKPDNFIALGNLGTTSLMAGRFDLARAAIERSLEIEENPSFYSNLGIVHYYLGDFGKSVEIHRKAVDLAPGTAVSWLNLADALYFNGETAEAAQAYAKAAELSEAQLSLNATDPEAMTTLAWARAMTGNTDEAVSIAGRAVNIDPTDPFSHYYLALTRLANDQVDAAIDATADALDNGYPADMLAAEPHVGVLMSNPRFAELLEEAGYKGEEQ